jgi:DNA-binding PadR family transcriptional regulator
MSDNKPSIDNYLPLTPAVFQILLALCMGEQHGYRIMQSVYENSGGKFRMGPGTLYGTIKRMLTDGLIEEAGERPDPSLDDERRRYYRLTEIGQKVVRAETERLSILVSYARAQNLIPSSDSENIA